MLVEASSFNPLADENLGSMEIGLAINLVLFGVVIIQSYTYYQRFGDDRMLLKVLVIVVLALEVLHSVAVTIMIYRNTVTLGGVPTNGYNSYPLTASIVLEVLITAVVQGWFAFRIYRLSGALYISFVCWSLSLLRLGGGLAVAAESFLDIPRGPNMIGLTARYAWLVTLALIVGAFVDVLIAASLCYYLKQLTSPEPSKSTSQLVDGLITWIIQTGMITSAASVAVVITFYIKRDTEIWFAIYLVTAKLYSNSFFVSLNLRQDQQEIHTTALGTLQFQHSTHLGLNISIAPSSHENYDTRPNFMSVRTPGTRSLANPSENIHCTQPKVEVNLDSDHDSFRGLDLEGQQFPSPPGIPIAPRIRY